MICLSIAESDMAAISNALAAGNYDLAEIRLDQARLSKKEVEKIFTGNGKLIATCRPGAFNEEDRRDMLSWAISAGAAYVDIEVESSDEFKTHLIELARKNNCRIIISYHNYEKTPDERELWQIVDWCFDSGADIAKIACAVNSSQDNARLLSLYNSERPLISIGMGRRGAFTRLAGLFMGAPFTYASLAAGKETAEGQINKEQLLELTERIKSVGI
jgi:3-dehydroquinate dehydratase-1